VNHRWVTRRKTKGSFRREWKRADELTKGDTLSLYRKPWEQPEPNWDIGYLAGVFDGEGWLNKKADQFGFAQCENECLENSLRILDDLGIEYRVIENVCESTLETRTKPCYSVRILDVLTSFAKIRPPRLMSRSDEIWEGKETRSKKIEPVEILNIERVGEKDLVATETSTGTLIAEGFLSHNTMFEMTPVPKEFPEAFKKADLILTPSTFCQDIFKPLTNKRVLVSKLGYDPYLWTYRQRDWVPRKKPFTWLWVGAPNPRKGWPALINAWGWLCKFTRDSEDFCFADPRFAELIMKTSTQQGDGDVHQHPAYPNLVVDSRRYERAEDLVELFHDANAFVLPTQGEGFGLTLLEAMATGLPVVTSKYGGQVDFVTNDIGYFHTHTFERMKDKYGVPLDAACPDVASLAKAMVSVMEDYPAALVKGTKGAILAREKFTWEHAAKKLCANIAKQKW